MKIVITSFNPGPPNGWKYKLIAWLQYELPAWFLFSGFVSAGMLISGFMMDVFYSTTQTDYTWFQRFGAVVVGWSIFIGILQKITFNHSNALKSLQNIPTHLQGGLLDLSKKRAKQATILWITEAISLLFGTLVWAFGDMITARLLHCGQWMCP